MELPSGTPPQAEKPYHSKRPHRKSRTGCKNCKGRKVKCDEAQPVCRACRLRRERCVYPAPLPGSSSPTSASQRVFSLAPSRGHTPPYDPGEAGAVGLLAEPMFRLPRADEDDMRLLWFYTTNTFGSLAVEAGRDPLIDNILRVKIVQLAFSNPFLMDCLLGLSATHLHHLNQEIPSGKAMMYPARAFAGYRRAIEEANPKTFPALVPASLLFCALSSQMFREKDPKPLFVIDWMTLWRGICVIVELTTLQTLDDAGMAPLFNRPPIDMDQAALHIPSNLLFMVTTIKEGDIDFPHIETYYSMLKYLGTLYQELELGYGPMLNLRVITFFTFVPDEFIQLARQRRPHTLVILAYYLAFTKFVERTWWMENICDREIYCIHDHLGEEWYDLLRIPLMANRVQDKAELARLILGNHAWEPSLNDIFTQERDLRVKNLTMVDDVGEAGTFTGQWVSHLPHQGSPI